MFPILILDEHSTNLVKNYDSIILPGNDLLTPYNTLTAVDSPSTTINLIRPNGGETFYVGSVDSIKWSSSGISTIKLEYTTNNGSTWRTIQSSIQASLTKYLWAAIPDSQSTQCKVRISDALDNEPVDMSDLVFTISGTPSTSYIYFSSNRTGKSQIFRMNSNGSNLTQVTNTSWDEYNPRISPDRTKILFGSNRNGLPRHYIMNIDGTNARALPFYDFADPGFHAWSPDGQKVVFSTQISFSPQDWAPHTVRKFTIDWSNPSNSLMEVLFGYYGTPSQNYEYYFLDWSPDGSKILHQRINTPENDNNADIYVYNLNNKSFTTLTFDHSVNSAPSWSPDGTKIVFNKNLSQGTCIYTMNSDGSNLINLSAINGKPLTTDIHDYQARYSRDGSKIVFISNRDGNKSHIFTMNSNGTGLLQLTSGNFYDTSPDYDPPTLIVSVKETYFNKIDYLLLQNYPNPFNPTTTIEFALPEKSKTAISIYNSLGQKVSELVNQELEAGYHENIWNAVGFCSGIYFYELVATSNNGKTFRDVKKIILLK